MANDEVYDAQYSILLIGNSDVGKSSILTKYVHNTFSSAFVPTIGIDFKIKGVKENDKNIKLRIWDTAGQEKFRTITNSYYRGAHGVVICYSVVNRDSFHGVKNWLTQVNQLGNVEVVTVLVGCKCDLSPREVSQEEGERMAAEHNCTFYEVSAKEGTNVNEVFKTILDRIHNKNSKSVKSNARASEVQSTIEKDKFLQSAYEVQISGASSWYNKNKINGRYVPQISKDGQLLLELGRFCYWNIDSPNTMMVYKDNHWVIKRNRKELAKVASRSIQCFPDTASLEHNWSENTGVYFTWWHERPDIKCVVLNTSSPADNRISVADIFESSNPHQRGSINMNMFLQYSKEPEQMGLSIPLFVKCCRIKIAILDLEYKALKKSYDYVSMGEVKIQRQQIDKTCKALMSTVSMPEQPKLLVSRDRIIAALETFLRELEEHYEGLCDIDTGNFDSARRCQTTQADLVAALEKLQSFAAGGESSRLSMLVREGMEVEAEMARMSSELGRTASAEAAASAAAADVGVGLSGVGSDSRARVGSMEVESRPTEENAR